MRRFELHRDEDETGISGTGIVAHGICWDDGRAVMRWLTEHTSTAIYDSMSDLVAIHGHNGRTRVVWIDGDPGHEDVRDWALSPMCARCGGGPPSDRGDYCIDCGAQGTVVYLAKWAHDLVVERSVHWQDHLRQLRRELMWFRGQMEVPDEVVARRIETPGYDAWWSVRLDQSSIIAPSELSEDEARRYGANRLSWSRFADLATPPNLLTVSIEVPDQRAKAVLRTMHNHLAVLRDALHESAGAELQIGHPQEVP